MKTQSLRRALLTLVIGLGLAFSLAPTTAAADRCSSDCKAKEQKCIDQCGEGYVGKPEKKALCEAVCKQDALVCGGSCDEE